MKKSKKRNHRCTNVNPYYTPGKNVFGDKAETQFIVLERETALQQMLDAICQLDGGEKEFTFDMSCFNGFEDELDEIHAKVEAFMAFRARFKSQTFVSFALESKAS